jgi:hypothetical protein
VQSNLFIEKMFLAAYGFDSFVTLLGLFAVDVLKLATNIIREKLSTLSRFIT